MSGTVEMSNLENITSSSTYTDDPSKRGWYIELTGTGEVPLRTFRFRRASSTSRPTPLRRQSAAIPAARPGRQSSMPSPTSAGAGSLTGGARSMTLGVGIPTAPVLSINPLQQHTGPVCHGERRCRHGGHHHAGQREPAVDCQPDQSHPLAGPQDPPVIRGACGL